MIFNCRKATMAISRSMDEEVPFFVRMGIMIHVAMCKLCREFNKQQHFLHRLLEMVPEDAHLEPSAALSPDARARILSSINNHL